MKSYIPLTKKEQQEKANKIARKTCPQCMYKNDYAICQKCIWHMLMNAMVGEEEF
jgi:hypothetical protein